mgnify:CR=1 FL=1
MKRIIKNLLMITLAGIGSSAFLIVAMLLSNYIHYGTFLFN